MTTATLRSTVNTQGMYRKVMQAAKDTLGNRRSFQADFEHGHWWITDVRSGAQWDVVDCQTQGGSDYFGFEQVTQGDEE